MNRILNSDFRVCSQLIPCRVGNPKSVTGWSSYPSSGSGTAKFTCAAATPAGVDGLVPGKLFFVEGAGTPRAPFTGVTGTVTNSPSFGYCNRITMPAGTFAGMEIGDTARLTGGSNLSPKLDYQVFGTDASTFIDVFGGSSGRIMTNETATFDFTFYDGAKDVDPTVNGHPGVPVPFFEAMPSYSLEMVESVAGYFYATLSGWYGDALGSGSARIWEIAVGDNGYGSSRASDGLNKTPSLRWWQTHLIDWDGVTQVTLPGSAFGCKIQKGITGIERMWWNLAQLNPAYVEITNPDELAVIQGKPVTFGMEWTAPTANMARPFLFDGTTYHYGPYFVPGGSNYQEVTVLSAVTTTATQMRAGIEIDGVVGDWHYGTQPISDFVTSIGRGNYVPWRGIMPLAFHQHPLRYVNSPPLPLEQRIKLAQETNGQFRGIKAMTLDLEGRCDVESSIFLMDGPQTNAPGIVLISHIEEGHIELSSGTSTISDGTMRYIGNGVVDTNIVGNANQMVLLAGNITALGIRRTVAGAGTITATLVVDGVSTSITAFMSGPTSSVVAFAPINLYVPVNPGSVVTMAVAAGGGCPTTQITAVVLFQKGSPPLHMLGALQPIGHQLVASPTPHYQDQMYLQCNTSGWRQMTIDMLSVEI